MKWLFNQCRRLGADLSLLAAGALAKEDRAKVETHLASCAACRTRLAELRKLTGELESLGGHLPQVEPTMVLRRRWQAAVRQSARPATESSWAWLSGRRAAWSGLAAIWALVLLLRISAPDAPKPAVVTTAPISLREVWLALKVEDGKSGWRADAGNPFFEKRSHPDALPPHSQMRRVRPFDSEVA